MIARQVHFYRISCFLFIITFGGTAVIAQTTKPVPPAGLINPGKWEITLHATEPIDSPPMVSVACIGPDEIARIAPPVSKANDECKLIAPGSLDRGVLMFTLYCQNLH